MKKPLFGALGALLLVLFSLGSASPASAQDQARIHLIHGIPGVEVDVAIGGEVAVPGFEFKGTQDLASFAGQTLGDVQVLLAGTDEVVIDIGDLTLPSTGNITAIAHLDADGAPTVTIFENDVSQLEAGDGRLVVRHTAAAPAVDVLAGGEVVFPAIANGKEAAADLPAGTVSASVVPAGETTPVVIGPADLPVDEGSSLIVYAVGSLEDDSIDVITESIDGLHGTPDAIHTGNSPVGSSTPAWPLYASAGLVMVAAMAAFGGTARLRPVRSQG